MISLRRQLKLIIIIRFCLFFYFCNILNYLLLIKIVIILKFFYTFYTIWQCRRIIHLSTIIYNHLMLKFI